jgi:hypothetical protein
VAQHRALPIRDALEAAAERYRPTSRHVSLSLQTLSLGAWQAHSSTAPTPEVSAQLLATLGCRDGSPQTSRLTLPG